MPSRLANGHGCFVKSPRCVVMLHAAVRRRDLPEGRAVEIHRVDGAARREQLGERERERASATPEIRPRRRPERRDVAVGEHLDGIMQLHNGII